MMLKFVKCVGKWTVILKTKKVKFKTKLINIFRTKKIRRKMKCRGSNKLNIKGLRIKSRKWVRIRRLDCKITKPTKKTTFTKRNKKSNVKLNQNGPLKSVNMKNKKKIPATTTKVSSKKSKIQKIKLENFRNHMKNRGKI
jgi:hypothetical protein